MPTGTETVELVEKADPWTQAANESLVVRTEKVTETKSVDLMYCVSQFCHYYPGEFQSGNISWRLFWLLYNEIPRLGASQRWNMTESVRVAYGMWEGTDEARRTLRNIHKNDLKLANGE